MERIPIDSWHTHQGHIDRYKYAALHTMVGESVNDIACGIGYGSTFLTHTAYVGYDKPAVPHICEVFSECDLNDHAWLPRNADVTVCFETLEHVVDPQHLADIISFTTRRAIFVSVPTQPTKHVNHYHLHDFQVDDIPLMFPDFLVKEVWEQPEELSHVWYLERRTAKWA